MPIDLFLVADTRLYTLPCRSVRPSVRHISKLRVVFALLLLPNRPRLDCRVSSLVGIASSKLFEFIKNLFLSHYLFNCGYATLFRRGFVRWSIGSLVRWSIGP